MHSSPVQSGNVCKWADDSQKLILEHFDTIHTSPSHIYQFAVPFCPSSSWLHRYYPVELLQAPKVVKGTRAEWGACSRTVLLGTTPKSLSYWNNVIAIGCDVGDIIVLDAITGSRITALSGHQHYVFCVTFSSDGRSLASGAYDKTVKLWDMQTGGVVRTFLGHTTSVFSVSISTDNTRIVSGSGEVCLWDIQTGECLYTIRHQGGIGCVIFSPIDPQHIFFISGNKVQEWDLNGQQIPLTYNGTCIAFSPDCTKFSLRDGNVVVVWDFNSRAIETQSFVDSPGKWCFSPDCRLIAVANGDVIYVWVVNSPESYLVGTLVGHHYGINSLVFTSQSSLISIAGDASVKFWQIGVLQTDSAITNPESAPLVSSPIRSVSLQARSGIAISSDEEGVVKIWDISTGLCKASFQTPARGHCVRDARMVDGRLIITWASETRLYIRETSKDGPPKIILQSLSKFNLCGLRISGDGSKVFCWSGRSIQVRSIHTGEPVGEVKLEQDFYLDPFQTDCSKIWVRLKDLSTQGWDFGVPNSPPVLLSDGPTERPFLDLVGSPFRWINKLSWVRNTVTGKVVFQFPWKYAKVSFMQWDGQYLIASFESGEVLILDFYHLHPQ